MRSPFYLGDNPHTLHYYEHIKSDEKFQKIIWGIICPYRKTILYPVFSKDHLSFEVTFDI